MNELYQQAKRKLEAEKNSGSYDRRAGAMRDGTHQLLSQEDA